MNTQKIKSRIKSILPENLENKLRKIYYKYLLSKLYRFDKSVFKSNSYFFNKYRYSEENLRARITFHYHALEKGLSHENIRFNFGETAYKELFYCMDKFISLGYDCTDTRFQQAISVIKAYIDLHKKNGKSVDFIEQKYNEYRKFLVNKKFDGGYTEYSNIDIPKYSSLNYNDLMLTRHSIRDYGREKIEDKRVFEAIEIATKSPSACNRQPWKVYYVKSKDIIENILDIQGGFTGHGKNIQGLLLITSDNSYYGGPHERNQNFVDGGIFVASLIYALTANQIATCPLHADLHGEQLGKIKSKLSIKKGEDLISFIAFGSFPESGKYANSPRDSYSDISIVI